MILKLQKKETGLSMHKIRLSSNCIKDSTVDGPGLRIVIWTQGCPHNCKGCHNPNTHDINGGFLEETDNVIKYINESKIQRGITLSGGEPFLQPLELIPIAQAAINKSLTVWAYSGYTYDQIIADENRKALLDYVDILVDGPFVLEQKDTRLVYKGSKNQRIIDVKQSYAKNRVVLSHYDDINADL
ncbi:MAG: anaerobic ribonucleoside-triphosphate reductase activating protein [Clostridia bacterium]|jgi:anaerobic ribonucleoside-triphosphate reductase activating protein